MGRRRKVEEREEESEQPGRKAKRNSGASTCRKANLSLIEVMKGDGKEIPEAVKTWVEHYKSNQKSAMAKLLTMLFEACGAKYSILEKDMDETNVDSVVAHLVDMGEVEAYPCPKRGFKKFKINLVNWWDNLVRECQNGALFDKALFQKCLCYIVALSSATPTIYRQMASLMGLQLVTSFISVANILGPQREATQRQLDAEKEKNVDVPRVESLTESLSLTVEKITTLEAMMMEIFTRLYKHRRLDSDPDIRLSCIESFGVWVRSYPSLFLRDEYVEFLGFPLCDDNIPVRKACVLALQNIFEVGDIAPSLKLFNERYQPRMLKMAYDIDISVSVCAIGLLKQLLRHRLVSDEEADSLYDLLIDHRPDARHAIGALVYDDMIAQNAESHSTGDSPEVHISIMLKTLRIYPFPTQGLCFVDAIWDYMAAMKDWKCIIGMLLPDYPSAELDDEDATNLTRLLFASVRKAVGEWISPDTDNRTPRHTKAQKKMFENSKCDITTALLETYPQLLRKFMPDKDKVVPLVQIICHMNLELYSPKGQGQEQNFKDILKIIIEAYCKHEDEVTLRACAKAFKFCASESRGELQVFARNQIKCLGDFLVATLKPAVKVVMNGGDKHSLLVILKRVHELHFFVNVPLCRLYQDLVDIRKRLQVDDEVVPFLLLNMFLHISWRVHLIRSSETFSATSLSSLLQKRDALLEDLNYFLCNSVGINKSKTILAYRVCATLPCAWRLFERTKFATTKLEILGYSPDIKIIEKYWSMCEQLLQVEEEGENGEHAKVLTRIVMFALVNFAITDPDAVAKKHIVSKVISHMEKYDAIVTDRVNQLITVLKKKGGISNILLEALKMAYQRYTACGNDEKSKSSKRFEECKRLAACLCGLHDSATLNEYKAEILNIVRKGIDFALSNLRLSFLECAMQPFVSKLPRSDILDIIKGVKREPRMFGWWVEWWVNSIKKK